MSYLNERKKYRILLCLMSAAFLVEAVLCIALGAVNVPFSSAVKAVLCKVPFLENVIDIRDVKESHIVIINQLRIPRVILGAAIGAALSVAGAAFQGIFRNPLADPYIIGTSSGGALGAAVAIVLNSWTGKGSFSIVSIFAFCGAFLATYSVYRMSRTGSKISVTAVILSGTALNSILSAIMSLIFLFNREQMNQIMFWTMGGLSSADWNQVAAAVPGIIAGIVVLYIYSRDLNLMLLGEESAQHLGVNTNRLKKIVLFVGAFITGLSVSVSGIIGFIGIVIPHIVRIIIGPDNRVMIPFAAVGGAMFLMGADALARTLMPPIEIPVGILTAAMGGPFFIYLLLKSRKKLV